MSQYTSLNALIDQYITTNGSGNITGAILNDVLKQMVNILGANYQFSGIATPTTNPGSPEQNIFYLATKGGTYSYFNNIVLSDGLSVLMWNGSWSSLVIIASDGIFDISAFNANGGALVSYASLAAALNSGANIPEAFRHSGMTIRFVLSSDSRYVQYRYLGTAVTGSPNPFVDTTNWQKQGAEVTVADNTLKIDGKATPISYMFEQGAINTADGQNNNDAFAMGYRLRTSFIEVSGDFEISVKKPYSFAIFFYNASGSFIQAGGVWVKESEKYTHTGKIRLIIAKVDGTDLPIVANEFINLRFNDKNIFNETLIKSLSNVFSFVQGTLSGDSGRERDDSTRIRTTFIQCNGMMIISAKYNYKFAYFLYDRQGVFVSTPGSWFTTPQTVTHNGMVRCLLAKSSDASITPSDSANLTVLQYQPVIKNSSPIKGKKISVLGDSMSAYQGQIPSGFETYYTTTIMDITNMWWQRLVSEYGMVKEVINAWSGSRVSKGYTDNRVAMCEESRLSNLGSPDVIVFFGGINDWRYLCALGDYHTTGSFDLTKFRPAYEYVLQQLLSRYPRAKVIACTPCQDGRLADSPNFPQINSVGYLYDYVETIRHLCKIYGVPCVDLFQNSGITYWNGQADANNTPTVNNTKTFDGLHPNISGQSDLFYTILKELL